jgi:hypothetical protein
MHDHVLGRRGNTLVRRPRLEPGEALPWHVDPFDRLTVVVRGTLLRIEYRDGRAPEDVLVAPGQLDWDAPEASAHRAVNVGVETYEEVTVFFLDRPDAVPQPVTVEASE